MAKQHEKGKWTKRGRRELSPSVERKGHRRRASPRAKEPLASEKRRELSRSSSPSIEKKGHRRRASPRAKEPLASEKRRELSRSRIRKPKGRPARSTKKETTEERVRGRPSRQRKEDGSARADSHVIARFSDVGKIIIDMLLQKVTRDECIDICYYVVDGPASDASLTCSMCTKRFTSQAFLEKHMQSKHPTEARGSSARAVPRKRPRKQPVPDETSSSSARAVPHTRPRSPTPYYYSSSESEADLGETCGKAETVRKVEGEANHGETCEKAKAKDTSIRPLRAREIWRACREGTVKLTEPRAQGGDADAARRGR
jgi:hypothetical protein